MTIALRSFCLWTLAILSAGPALGDVQFNVSFNDPDGSHAAFQSSIRSAVQAAGAQWARYLKPPAGMTPSIEVQINFGNQPTANGTSVTSGYVATRGGYDVFEQGMAAEIRTGVDPNGTSPDVTIEIGDTYLRNEMWFDPDPATRLAPVPVTRTDAVSVFIHALGHALGFNGWRAYDTGQLPLEAGEDGAYCSTFDEHIEVDPGPEFLFTGAVAEARYGGPLPLTAGNIDHLANAAPGLGADLVPDLMNGVVYYRGSRYFISNIDLAVMQDIGVPLTRSEIFPPQILSLKPESNGLTTVQWTGANYRLRLEQTASLADPVWVTVARQVEGTKLSFTTPDGGTQFYRLVAE